MLSSASLFHFTRNLQSLRGILAEGFKVNPSFERMDILSRAFGGPPDGDETGIPMVCFCDIPLSQTTEHMDRYGKYAIGLSKGWGEARKIAPVLYGHSGTPLLDALIAYRKLLLKFKVTSDPDPAARRNALEAGRLVYYFKAYEGDARQADGKIRHTRFYDEREWRYVPDSIEDCPTISREAMADPNARLAVEAYLATCSRLMFRPQDVTHIIVATDADIPPLLEGLADAGILQGNDASLVTRITTAERIRADY